jgi:hypothetical protein
LKKTNKRDEENREKATGFLQFPTQSVEPSNSSELNSRPSHATELPQNCKKVCAPTPKISIKSKQNVGSNVGRPIFFDSVLCLTDLIRIDSRNEPH